MITVWMDDIVVTDCAARMQETVIRQGAEEGGDGCLHWMTAIWCAVGLNDKFFNITFRGCLVLL